MAWADPEYGYKKKITIQNGKVAGDETDFPVLVSVTDGDLADTANGGHVQNSNGYDIVFYDSTETTLLKHEIERYVNTSGLLVFWVKINSLSSTSDTVFYVYYGKAGVGADPSSTDTWDANFVGVWHMDDTTTSTISDSTSYGHTGTKGDANNPDEQTCKIGKGQNFDGDDYIDCTDTSYLSALANATISLWVNGGATQATAFEPFIGKYYHATKREWIFHAHDIDSGKIRFFKYDQSADANVGGYITASIYDNAWHHIVVSYDSGTDINSIDAYLDGNPVAISDESSGTFVAVEDTDEPVMIGRQSNLARDFTGKIDEVRISNKVRSANWISTTHNTTDSPSTFMIFGAEEALFKPPTVAVGDPLMF